MQQRLVGPTQPFDEGFNGRQMVAVRGVDHAVGAPCLAHQ